MEKDTLKTELQRANEQLGALVNLISSEGDLETILKLNDYL